MITIDTFNRKAKSINLGNRLLMNAIIQLKSFDKRNYINDSINKTQRVI